MKEIGFAIVKGSGVLQRAWEGLHGCALWRVDASVSHSMRQRRVGSGDRASGSDQGSSSLKEEENGSLDLISEVLIESLECR